MPEPYLIVPNSGLFTLSGNLQLELSGVDSALNGQIKVWIKTDAKQLVRPEKTLQTRISIQLTGPRKWPGYLRKLQLNPAFEPGQEGYVLQLGPNSILLLAQTQAGLFYGFQTLRQLFKLPAIPCCIIYDKPSFSIRAWLETNDKGLDFLQGRIRLLSHYKLNTLILQKNQYPNLSQTRNLTQELRKYAAYYRIKVMDQIPDSITVLNPNDPNPEFFPGEIQRTYWINRQVKDLAAEPSKFNYTAERNLAIAKGLINTITPNNPFDLMGNYLPGLLWNAGFSWNANRKEVSVQFERFLSTLDAQLWRAEIKRPLQDFLRLGTSFGKRTTLSNFPPLNPVISFESPGIYLASQITETDRILKQCDSLFSISGMTAEPRLSLIFQIKQFHLNLEMERFRQQLNQPTTFSEKPEIILETQSRLMGSLDRLQSAFLELNKSEGNLNALDSSLACYQYLRELLIQLPYVCTIENTLDLSGSRGKVRLKTPIPADQIEYRIVRENKPAKWKRYKEPFSLTSSAKVEVRVLHKGSIVTENTKTIRLNPK